MHALQYIYIYKLNTKALVWLISVINVFMKINVEFCSKSGTWKLFIKLYKLFLRDAEFLKVI